MNRYAKFGERETQGATIGDTAVRGVFMAAPGQIPAGFVAEAINAVFDDQVPETRPGKRPLPWLNQLVAHPTLADVRTLAPWTEIHGFEPFRDPNGREWALIAADGACYRTVEHNAIFSMSLPAGVRLRETVNFLQAFNVMILQQGKRRPNLVLDDIGTGWRLAVPDWNPATAYDEDDIVAFGELFEVASIALDGSTATVTTVENHAFETGDRVYLYYDTRAQLATAFAITVTGEKTFTLSFSSPAAAEAPSTVVSITRALQVATVTSVAHGLVTGRRIVISGAVETEYNIEATVTVTGVDTFEYTVTGTPTTPATGTITFLPVVYASRQVTFYQAAAGGTLAGESPITTPAKWTAHTDFQAPWTLGGAFLQSRVFYPFSKDLVAASELNLYNDVVAQKNVFRINQGDSDELIAVAAFNKRALVAFKRRSIYLAAGLNDLETATLERVPVGYGLAARRSVAHVGQDLMFLTHEPAVRSLYATTENEVLGRDQRVSLPIDPLMRRLNTLHIADACAAFAGGKYFLAVPLDSAQARGPKTRFHSGGASVATPVSTGADYLVDGTTYHFSTNPDHAVEVWHDGAALTDGQQFVADGLLELRSASGSGLYDFNLQPVVRGNNAILTYNTRNEAWEGVHQGEGIYPTEMKVLTIDGRERLVFASLDGLLYLWGEGRLDGIYDPSQRSGVGLTDIELDVLSRGYDYQMAGLKKFTQARLALAMWNPRFEVSAKFEGVNDEQTLTDAPVTRSRSTYDNPWDEPPFDTTNAGDDHAQSGRQDYSVALNDGDILYLGVNGVDYERDQECEVVHRLHHGRRDRLCQVRLSNTQGYIRQLALELTGEAGERTGGIHH
jgi:hypothetical protein